MKQKLKVYYEPVKCSPVVRQQRIDEAFDILFEEVLLEMQQKQIKVQEKQKQKGGGNYGRLGKSRDESYLEL